MKLLILIRVNDSYTGVIYDWGLLMTTAQLDDRLLFQKEAISILLLKLQHGKTRVPTKRAQSDFDQ
jgi:hypothetical protein